MCKVPETLLCLSLRHSWNARNLSLRPWFRWNRMDRAFQVREAQLQRSSILRSFSRVRRKWNKWHVHYSYAFRPSTMLIICVNWPRTQAYEVGLELIHLRGTRRNCSPTSGGDSWSDCSVWSGSSSGCLLCPTGRWHRDRPWTCWEGLTLLSSPEIPWCSQRNWRTELERGWSGSPDKNCCFNNPHPRKWEKKEQNEIAYSKYTICCTSVIM